jgi:hypothetical protein
LFVKIPNCGCACHFHCGGRNCIWQCIFHSFSAKWRLDNCWDARYLYLRWRERR